MHLEIAPYLLLTIFIIGFAVDSIYDRLPKKERFEKSHDILMVGLTCALGYSFLAVVAGVMNLTIIPEYSRTKDNVHVVYQNNKQADVTFKENNDRVYTGGSEATDDLTIPRSLSEYVSKEKQLTITKNKESITKSIDESEIVGPKDGIITKIEYGTRTRTYAPLGLPVVTTKKSFVRVHLSPKNPADRKIVENIFNGKE